MELIPTPLELLTVTILWFTDSNPWIGAIILISDIDWCGVCAVNEVSSTTRSLSGL